MSADDLGIHNASCEYRTPCVFPCVQVKSLLAYKHMFIAINNWRKYKEKNI